MKWMAMCINGSRVVVGDEVLAVLRAGTDDDARVIAAGPEMLDALKQLVAWGECVKKRAGVRMGDVNTGALESAYRAIAKAEGGEEV